MSDTLQLSRAQTVRQRRRKQVERRVTKSGSLASRPVARLTTRASSPYAGSRVMEGKRARHQYQAAITMPGIEVRMPGITVSSRSLMWRMISSALSAVLLAVLYVAWNAAFFQVGLPEVTGNSRVTVDEINAVLCASGQPSFVLVPSQLENRLRMNYPEIISAQVRVTFPNILSVAVAERTPLIAWQQGNAYTWIDGNGVAFRPQGAADNLITVSARGTPPPAKPSLAEPNAPIPYITPDMVSAIQLLAPNVPAGETMLYDPKYGLGWTDSRGWQVFFGNDETDLTTKILVYQALVKSLQAQGVSPAFISVQYASAPYYRMSQ